jgi:hypothetical protein
MATTSRLLPPLSRRNAEPCFNTPTTRAITPTFARWARRKNLEMVMACYDF